MGVRNIHILKPDVEDLMNPSARQAQAMVQDRRIAEHRRGGHPFGKKRRDCLLCLAGK